MGIVPQETVGGAVLDGCGRRLRDLRLSVIDNCNLRCTYCMPRDTFGEGYRFLPERELLSFDEIERLTRAFAELGVEKVRITGGEPLLRKGVADLVARIRALDGIVDIALTTNGLLLRRQAQALFDAGLDRITVSLDAIDDTISGRMNGRGVPVANVLSGIDAAHDAGFRSIKVNAVVQRGVNDGQVLPMIEHFRGTGVVVRFIEYMDVGTKNGWRMDDVVPSRELHDRIHARYPLRPLDPTYRGEVASRYAFEDGRGEVGFISSVTDTFCGGCTRARISADGALYTCLFGTQGHDLRAALRGAIDHETLVDTVRAVWSARDDRYSELRTAMTEQERTAGKVEMYQVGG